MDVLRRIRNEEWGKSVLVFFLTNLSDNEIVSQAEDLGVTEFFVKKEWTPDDIVKRIMEKLRGLQ